jgi:class 3 adenylate cyclase
MLEHVDPVDRTPQMLSPTVTHPGLPRTRVSWSHGRAERSRYRLACEYGRPRRSRGEAGRFRTTVLITDIVDSTVAASRLGDRAWCDLLARHYAACRAVVSRNGGELVNTTGDGIVAIFDAPGSAVRAAVAMQTLSRASGIELRAGLHSGECERIRDDVAGLAVHIAARVCALGTADAVMTTGTVRDLALGSRFAFEPVGDHGLKGVPGRWTVYSATELAA